jgi:hypothetical protein
MTRYMDEICARCDHFKMKEYPDHARVGLGRCMGYDNTMTPLNQPFKPWTTPCCSRYKRPANFAERDEWVKKKQAKQQPAVQLETKG